MVIGSLQVILEIPGNDNLKGKRRVLKGFIERVRSKFNVSVSEIDNHDKHQLATIGIVCVGNDKRMVNQMLQEVISFVEVYPEIVLIDYYLEML